ncbi:MAG: transcriptional regulator, PadR-like family [Caulobacteraceae bacterium]|jgi:DNA-binding PadR family transcriptional regulator|nr:transcriptional regulator, PadR-like family [Caulobacteraceae bacterium]
MFGHHHHLRRGAACASGDRGFGFGAGRHGRGSRGFGPFGPPGSGGPPYGRRGRFFEQGDLRWVLLSLIAGKPSHGYELIKAIEERLGGAYSPSPGVVYPTLTLLEDMGLIVATQSEGARKAFAITDEGRAALETNKATVEAIFQRMAQVAELAGGGPAPQIIRAMENLRTALRLRLEGGKLSDAQVAHIAAALDGAARAVESD